MRVGEAVARHVNENELCSAACTDEGMVRVTNCGQAIEIGPLDSQGLSPRGTLLGGIVILSAAAEGQEFVKLERLPQASITEVRHVCRRTWNKYVSVKSFTGAVIKQTHSKAQSKAWGLRH